MASEKQIAANCANAKRSTGPKTLAGKMASSRNAFRHGLSGPLRLDPVTSAKVEAIAQALAGKEANEDRLTSASDFARAQLELLRIRSTRTEMINKIELNDVNLKELRRIAALDRYERYCFTKRRRASTCFDAQVGGMKIDGMNGNT
jgi:hypothetical protein